MAFPLRFPHHLDVIRQDAEAFRRLSPDERTLSVVDLINFGEEFLRQSPHRANIAREQRRYEDAWQQALRAEFHKHGL